MLDLGTLFCGRKWLGGRYTLDSVLELLDRIVDGQLDDCDGF